MSNRKVVGQLKRASINIEWEVADFLSLSADVDEKHESSMFSFCNASWFLQLYPNGQKKYSSEGYIGVYVMRGDSGPPVTVTYRLFLKKTDGRIKACKEDTKAFQTIGWGRPKVIGRSELIGQRSKFIPSGNLTIVCSLEADEMKGGTGSDVALQTIQSGTVCIGKDVALQTTECGATNSKALRDFEKIFLNKDACDVTLQVKEQKFGAHRAILRARSSVFASMFSHDMKEKNSGLIDIKDCDPEHFADFLRFLYCGSADSITPQNACSLYRAADKYDVQDLKSECLALIKSHLDVDNFCDAITLALQHGETELIEQAADFFGKNMLKIIVTVKWQVFLTENPIQGNELTIKALSAQKSSNY